MTKTEFSPSIPSRPTYAPLLSQGAVSAIMVADTAGAEALCDLAAKDGAVMDQAHILIVGEAPEALIALSPVALLRVPDLNSLTAPVTEMLSNARMGTALYLAGSEGLIGHVTAIALELGMPLDAIQAEHRGTIARRMQCVHCKGITDDVTTDPFTCSHCGLNLFVRDHFSRRLGVFQGVCVDAETPGIVPEQLEIRP